MTYEECMTKVQEFGLDATCKGYELPWWVNWGTALLGMFASAAIIWTAILIQRQLKAVKQQIASGDHNHLSSLVQAKDVAIDHMQTTKDINKMRATLDILWDIQSAERWVANRKKFAELKARKDGLEKHAQTRSVHAYSIRLQLNQYELIAIGIKMGILDKGMYSNFFRGTCVGDFKAARNFIDKEREGGAVTSANHLLWIEFERLGKEFEAEMKKEVVI